MQNQYQCACPHVMRLDSKDNRTCIANEQVLLFIMGDEIRGIDLMQPNHHTIPTIRQSPQVSYNYVMFIYVNLIFRYYIGLCSTSDRFYR